MPRAAQRAAHVLLWGLGLSSALARAEEPPAQRSPAQEPQTQQPAQEQARAAAQQVAQPAPAPRTTRNVVVARFVAPDNSQARAGVLQTLADHSDVEVVSIDDVTFAAQRLQADPNTADGRAKLSRELGIDTWLDGRVDDHTAHLQLTAGDGTLIREVSVEADNSRLLDALTGERMWAALGPLLSPQERYRRALLGQYELARSKFDARVAEAQRQLQRGRSARRHRAEVLRAQFALAQRKQAALVAEVAHQAELAKARRAAEPPAPPAAVAKSSTKPQTRAERRAAVKRAKKSQKRAATAHASNRKSRSQNAHRRRASARARRAAAAANSGKDGPIDPQLLSKQPQ